MERSVRIELTNSSLARLRLTTRLTSHINWSCQGTVIRRGISHMQHISGGHGENPTPNIFFTKEALWLVELHGLNKWRKQRDLNSQGYISTPSVFKTESLPVRICFHNSITTLVFIRTY